MLFVFDWCDVFTYNFLSTTVVTEIKKKTFQLVRFFFYPTFQTEKKKIFSTVGSIFSPHFPNGKRGSLFFSTMSEARTLSEEKVSPVIFISRVLRVTQVLLYRARYTWL